MNRGDETRMTGTRRLTNMGNALTPTVFKKERG
jgi:hypothetical protein